MRFSADVLLFDSIMRESRNSDIFPLHKLQPMLFSQKEHLRTVYNKTFLNDQVYPTYTLPETNIAPENRPLEKEIPIGNHHF